MREQLAQNRHNETRACPGFFIGAKTEVPKAESRVEFPGRGLRQQAPSQQLGGLGVYCERPSGVRVRARPPKVSTIS